MANAPQLPVNPRSVIIVDACALFDLMMPVPDEWVADDALFVPTNLYDVFKALADQGHDILVPEMVMLEVGDSLSDGTCLSDYFSSDKWAAHSKDARNLFVKHTDNIVILPPDENDRSEPAQYVRALRAVIDDETRDIKHKRHEIATICKRRGRNYGERAALNLSESLKDIRAPFFFLSNDLAALRQAKESGACRLSLADFMYVLNEKNVLAHMGIQVDTNELFRTMKKWQIESERSREGKLKYAVFANDCSREAFGQTIPFYEKPKPIPQPERPARIVQQPTALERFVRRYPYYQAFTPTAAQF